MNVSAVRMGAMSRVLVTGAGRGIGRAIALRMAAAGWDVLAGVRSAEAGDELTAVGGHRIEPIQLDVTSDDDLYALSKHVVGGLDALVNNAGGPCDGPIEAVRTEDLRGAFDLNVIGQVGVTQAVLPQLRASRGRVLFVSSVNGRISTPMSGAYSATKFAVEAIADALRVELRPWRIDVVIIQPGPTATDIWGRAKERFDAMAEQMAGPHRDLYSRQIAASRRMIRLMQMQAVPPDKVAAVVERALTARSPKPRYPVTVSGRAQLISKAVTPTRVFDAALGTAVGARRRHRHGAS
jgi:NAD(P)-dependent dehydrogenase (short-subunit alcohol dehydrogenase family)